MFLQQYMSPSAVSMVLVCSHFSTQTGVLNGFPFTGSRSKVPGHHQLQFHSARPTCLRAMVVWATRQSRARCITIDRAGKMAHCDCLSACCESRALGHWSKHCVASLGALPVKLMSRMRWSSQDKWYKWHLSFKSVSPGNGNATCRHFNDKR